jgi:3-oxoacyl-[acyl-carrier protein] reductase
MRLAGRVALITGAGSGIGRACAHLFAREGASVSLVGRTLAKLSAVAQEIGADPSRVRCVAADLSVRGEARRAVEECAEHFGGLDIVINNAGIGRQRPMLDVDEALVDEVIAHNVKNPLWVAQFAAPHLIRRGGGVIVNISSSLSLKPVPGSGIYSMSKAALDMLTKALALELGAHRIRVNTVCPAMVDTPLHQTYLSPEDVEKRRHSMEQIYPLGRIGTPEEIAEAALFLSSDAASWITGSTLLMDGGRLVK